jgi:DNA topoisomerase-3
MGQIAELTRHIVGRAKQYEHDTIPGDFGILKERCPKCGGEIHERYREFKCITENCPFYVRKAMSGRMFEYEEVEQLIREKQIGPLHGFRSKMGKPFAAVLRLNAENVVEFDFGPNQKDGEGAPAEVDFTGMEPLGKCPSCQNNVFELPMQYVCEKAVGPVRTCEFRCGRLILQQPIDGVQIRKLLSEHRTDLLTKFISKKGRPFKAFLVVKGPKVEFEFEERKPRGKAGEKAGAPKEPVAKLDFTGQEPLGKCPKCGGNVFETDAAFLCEKSQAERRPCKFKIGKLIAQLPIDRALAVKLLANNRTELLHNFISRAGRPFSAYLVIEDPGKVVFDFPPRD